MEGSDAMRCFVVASAEFDDFLCIGVEGLRMRRLVQKDERRVGLEG